MDEDITDDNDTEQATEATRFSAEYMSDLRRESRRYRIQGEDMKKQAEELTTKLEEHKSGLGPEVETAREHLADIQLRLSDAEIQAAEIEVKNMVTNESFKLGITDVDKAQELIDRSLIDGTPASVKRALTVLIKTNPDLTTPEPIPPAAGVGGVGRPPLRIKPSVDQMWAAIFRRGGTR